LAFRFWLANPDSLNCLLCAGTQIWYTLLVLDDIKDESLALGKIDLISDEQLKNNLMRVTRYGFEHFSNDSAFNAYFGYMISVMPYLFLDYNGDYLGWQERGNEMIRFSFHLNPNNLFAEALYLELDGCGRGTPFYNACQKIWSRITPEQWGYSGVQRYFFRILHGDSFFRTGGGAEVGNRTFR